VGRNEEACSLFASGANCAQAVFCTFAGDHGIPREAAMRIATGFGRGMAMAGTCGAVTGAFMALGVEHGMGTLAQQEKKKETYELLREFTRRFAAKNGSVLCRELLGCDIETPQGAKEAQEKGLFTTRCVQLVDDAARILEEMLPE
jgi:C_GCAxxG_C_C family probable redox protein